MRRLTIAVCVLVSALACWACSARYQQNDLELVVASRATLMCTCVYTMGMSEQWCDVFSTYTVPLSTYTIDDEHQVVEAQFGLMWSDRARLVSDQFGCIFE